MAKTTYTAIRLCMLWLSHSLEGKQGEWIWRGGEWEYRNLGRGEEGEIVVGKYCIRKQSIFNYKKV